MAAIKGIEQYKEVIQFLEQYGEAVRRIDRRRAEYDEETFLIDAIRSPSDNDGMPHGSGISRMTENKALRLADKRLRIVDAELEAVAIRQEVFDVVDQVEGVPGDVLFERYIHLKKWDDVYVAVNYSESQTWRYYKAGLEQVEMILATKMK